MLNFALRAGGTLVLAAAGWIVVGLLVTAPLGAIYGWSGHPAIPAAPLAVYMMLYLVVLPIVCIAAGWKVTRWVETRVRRKPGSARA